jgi:predicted Zn-dependent peptidase
MAPERVAISVAGAFDRSAILDVVNSRFASLAPRPSVTSARAASESGRVSETRKLEQTHLALSWPSPPAGDDRLFAARLLSEIFGGGMSSRLFQEVREKRGLVYAIDSGLDTLEDDGRLSVYAGCSAKNARTVAEIVRDQLALMAEHGPTQAELTRAKAVARAQMLMGLEAPTARAEARVSQIFTRDRLADFAEIRAKMDAVTIADVQAMAKNALTGPVCVAAIGPKAGHGALDVFGAS